MTGSRFTPPSPRAALLSPELTRPVRGDAGKTAQDPNRLWLDKNENSDPALVALTSELLRSLPPSVIYAYPEQGPLYRKLAAHVGVAPSELLLTAGSDAAIRAIFEAYVEPGDGVVYTDPSFSMYEVYGRMYGARRIPVSYKPANDGPRLYVSEIIEAIRAERPKIVCLPNPDSPTGTIMPEDELRSVIEAAGAAGALILIDEAYYPFYAGTVVPWIRDYPHLVVCRTAAKAWGLAGMRIGYSIASEAIMTLLHKVRPMFEVNTVAVALFEKMLDHEDAMRASVARLNAGKKAFLDAMQQLGLRSHAGHGNFFHVAFADHADKVHAAIEPLIYYRKMSHGCLAGFSRFSATTPELFAPVIDKIREAVRHG